MIISGDWADSKVMLKELEFSELDVSSFSTRFYLFFL